MRLTLGAGVTRAGVDETIAGLWTFANALGLLTDVIGERSGGVGVTVDGMLIRDSGIPEAAVTAHEAALSILETQIPNGTVFPRLNSTEIITGLWVFAHSSGLLTDGILERTAEAGVTIDGLLVKDSGIVAAGALDLGNDIELSERTASIGSGPVNNLDTGTVTVQLLSATGEPTNISGFTGGRAGRLIMVHNNGGNDFTLTHEGAGSDAANRMALPNSASVLLTDNEAVMLWYDTAQDRWKAMAWAHI